MNETEIDRIASLARFRKKEIRCAKFSLILGVVLSLIVLASNIYQGRWYMGWVQLFTLAVITWTWRFTFIKRRADGRQKPSR